MENQNPIAKLFLDAQAELRLLGITLSIVAGEYSVNYEHGSGATAYFTGDLQDAIAAGRRMAAAIRTEPLPIGPTGRRGSRRAMMYRHNRKIAARRRRQAVTTMILIERSNPGELPTIQRVAMPYVLRLAAVEAHRAGLPMPTSLDEAAAVMRDYSPRFRTFYTPDEADKWADAYEGMQSEAIRHAVRHYVADSNGATPEDLEPTLNEVG
jgi:hypothetical protein